MALLLAVPPGRCTGLGTEVPALLLANTGDVTLFFSLAARCVALVRRGSPEDAAGFLEALGMLRDCNIACDTMVSCLPCPTGGTNCRVLGRQTAAAKPPRLLVGIKDKSSSISLLNYVFYCSFILLATEVFSQCSQLRFLRWSDSKHTQHKSPKGVILSR